MNEKMQIGSLYQSVTTVKKNCLYISTRENKAVTRQKELYPVASFTQNQNNLYFEVVDMSVGQQLFKVYIDYGFITYDLHLSFYEYHTPEEIQNRFNSIPADQFEYEYMKERIVESANKNQFVNVAQIKLLEIAGEKQELIDTLIKSRQEYINAKEEKEKREYNARVEKATMQYNELIQEYNNALLAAEQAILNKSKVVNKEMVMPELDGAYVYKNDKSLVLELFKKFEIKVPLKTQGWINAALAEIKFNDDATITYSYFSSSKNSTVFMKYLQQLEIAIQEAYNKVDTNTVARMNQEEEKENKIKSIPTLKWNEIDQHSYRQQMENNMFIKQNEVVELSPEEVKEVAGIAYKALSSKNIEVNVANWIDLHEILESEYKGNYYFSVNGNYVKVYPRLVNGEVKMLYLKNTKKQYMSIA